MSDDFASCYRDLLTGSYDCVDRIVLNAFYSVGHSPSGFRYWWRQLFGSDESLDDNHLMRMAGRFSRRLQAYTKANHIPMIYCDAGTRKHEVGEAHLAENPNVEGLFLVLVARAQASLWEVHRGGSNGFLQLKRKARPPFVNHYYFHINDPDWGHITIRMCGHPPFAAQIILNGHEYVSCRLKRSGRTFRKEGNCFTNTQDGSDLALVADALRQPDAIGCLSQVCERWIYSACLCFALTTEERERSGFRYQFSVYQVEYSRNLLFRSPKQMDQVMESMLDRSRSRLRIDRIKTIMGMKQRPHRQRKRMEIVVEKPTYDLTYFNLHFGKITLKVYTKGEHVLRFEAIVHNTKDLNCGRVLAKFPDIVVKLAGILTRFMDTLNAIDRPFISEPDWDGLSTPSRVGKARVGGVDVQKPRMRSVLEAILALAPRPQGMTASDVAAKVRTITGQTPSEYGPTRASYDLRKLRGKQLIAKIAKSRRYEARPDCLRSISAALVLRENVIKPILAGVSSSKGKSKVDTANSIDQCYRNVQDAMASLLDNLGIAA
jgi:hypothetical protein